ncbi:LysE family translocator [Sciscionella sediminilitoris]|uniref:LysE family translocator n=1 Tax=Sciscionella sediminilitoris TaxID=1445613 RepID=UPI0004DF1A37|nr:LysE family translocator [Sciscionella sp. SE31]
MQFSVVLSFMLACLVLNLVPGPGMLFTIAQGIRRGPAGGLVSALGMATGMLVHGTLATLGLSALLSTAPVALDVVRIGGALFLLYLAVTTWRSGADGFLEPGQRTDGSLGRTYLSAVLTNIANPKVIVFYLSFVPQFLSAGGWPIPAQTAVLGAILILLGLLVDAVIGLCSGALSALLRAKPAIRRWMSRIAAGVFAGLGIRLLSEPAAS